MAEKIEKKERRTVEDLLKEVERIQEREAQLKERIRKRRVQDKAREKRMRNHAMIVIAGMVMQRIGGDWKNIDLAALDDYLSKYEWKLKELTLDEPFEDASAANAYVRDFELQKREARERQWVGKNNPGDINVFEDDEKNTGGTIPML